MAKSPARRNMSAENYRKYYWEYAWRSPSKKKQRKGYCRCYYCFPEKQRNRTAREREARRYEDNAS